MRKRVFALVLVMLTVTCIFAPTARAAAQDSYYKVDNETRYSQTNYISASLSIIGSTAHAYVAVSGISSVTNIVTYAYLETDASGSWETYDLWMHSTSGIYQSYTEVTPVVEGANYRVRVSGYVYVKSSIEMISIISNVVSY